MINNQNLQVAANYQLTWPAIFWRLLVTLLLLLMLAGPGLSLFRAVTANPGARVLPPLAQEGESGK
jgi:hypothetical protein